MKYYFLFRYTHGLTHVRGVASSIDDMQQNSLISLKNFILNGEINKYYLHLFICVEPIYTLLQQS